MAKAKDLLKRTFATAAGATLGFLWGGPAGAAAGVTWGAAAGATLGGAGGYLAETGREHDKAEERSSLRASADLTRSYQREADATRKKRELEKKRADKSYVRSLRAANGGAFFGGNSDSENSKGYLGGYTIG